MKFIHIIAGLLALAAGAVALCAAKGSPLHRKSGMVFVVAMLVMTGSAAVMAAFIVPNMTNAIAGMLTFYLVSTALLAVRRTVAQARALLTGFMLAAMMLSAIAYALGFAALDSATGLVDGIPAAAPIMFGTVALLAAALDARMLIAGSIAGAQRIARHLWRMTFAMWIATSSFFLGQMKFFPQAVRQSGLLVVPVLAVLVLLFYWLWRVLIRRRTVASTATASSTA